MRVRSPPARSTTLASDGMPVRPSMSGLTSRKPASTQSIVAL